MDSTQAKLLLQSLEGKTVNGWTIGKFLGNGKSAVVVSATKKGQVGALKIFHPELVERHGKDVQLQRILREKGLIGAEHPNLVHIFDGGECSSTGHLYVVMELLPYKNLHEVRGNVPLELVPQLISQIASAARFLEDRGLVHRDIKPENIAVSDDYSTAILLDLGVLRPIGSSNLTDVDQRSFIGTLRYSSPEFLLRQEEDTLEGWRAVTFYQLGAVLYDLLMGQELFSEYSEPFARLVEAVQNITPEIYSVNARCVALARHCLTKNPRTRLELVNWKDFSLQNATAEIELVSALRERIRSRQKFFQSTRDTSDIPAGEHARLINQILLDVSNRLESRIAAIINDQGCFPLRQMRSEKNPKSKRLITRVDFEKDEILGLAHKLSIKLEVVLIDENSGNPNLKASSSSIYTDDEISSELFPFPFAFFPVN